MPLHWPTSYAIAAAVDDFALACCIYSCSNWRRLRVGQYPAAAADAFALAHCICGCSSFRYLPVGLLHIVCRWLRIGPLHMQLKQPPMASCWPTCSCSCYRWPRAGQLRRQQQWQLLRMASHWPAAAAAEDGFMLAHLQQLLLWMASHWPVA